MKNKLLLGGLFAALSLTTPLVFTGCAGPDTSGTSTVSTPTRTEQHLVKVVVNGLVCNFCATNLDKTFGKTPGVEKAYVNLAASSVLLKVTDPSKPDDAAIRATVADAGFEVRSIERVTGDFDAARDALKESAKAKAW